MIDLRASCVRTGHLGRVIGGYPHHVVARSDLLSNERLRRCHEDDGRLREPAVEVVHDDGGDERLAESGGQHDKRVVEQRLRDDAPLVLSHWVVGRVDPEPPRFAVEAGGGGGGGGRVDICGRVIVESDVEQDVVRGVVVRPVVRWRDRRRTARRPLYAVTSDATTDIWNAPALEERRLLARFAHGAANAVVQL